ncbi:PKD domain-containing protein [Candidatus Woesearchaeota archaeon]|nr:PKD domain-containing protein [Candidatus Woesearchaeota archaeon]
MIDDNAPVVDLIVSLADPAAPGWEGDMYDFECVITGGDDPMDVTIDFGDGSAPVLGTSASHAYTDEGMYIASCEVFDADLDYGYDEEVVDVANNVPVVDVFVDEASAFEPHTVEYNCNVGDGNEPFDYLVEFGDGDTSTSPTGTHDYPDPGSYPLRCTVTDDDGDIGWDEVGIHVWDNPPVVSMTATPVVGLEGVTVHFDCDISGGNEDFDVTLDFDEGAPYEAFGTSERHHSATHVYAFEGEYNATCRVTDDDGDVGDDWEVITVIDNPPVVDLEVTPDSGLEPLTVDYECTVGGGNEPFGFSVDLDGDGFEDTTSPSGTYTYTVPGIYAMTCTVTDADGDVDSDTVDVEVIDNPPVVDLVPSHMGGPEGSDIFFECLVSEGNEPFDYFINFDDGSTTTADAEWHTFPFEGLYNVSCEVTDDDGDVGLDWALINISNAGPVVNVEVDVPSGLEPLTVEYTCDAAGGNEPYDYEIDFDDGSAHEFTPTGTHTYAVPGIYDLTCTVTDDDGDVGSDHVGIHVIDNPPVVDLTYTYVGELWEGVVVDFTCGWTDGNADFDVTLDFGDGAPLVTSSDGTPVTASHTYSLEGLYTATCTVIDDDGDVDSDSEDLDILNNPPVVNLEVDTISGFEPLSVDYNCTVGDGNEPFDYLIVFDDGTTSTSPTGTHDYPVPGTYEMTCTVTDADGDVASDHEGIHVIDNPPVVSFSADPMEGPEGVEVDFDCSWTGGNPDFDMTIVFGDGASETYFGPDTSYTTSHTYPLEGVYTASCEVRDDDLDVDTETLDINVTNNVPVVNVWVNETSGLEPHSIEYICSAGGGNAPYSYSVDIDGDGFEDTTSPTGTYTYTTPGLYDLTCTVTDDDGDMGSDTQRVEVLDDAPLVDLTYSYSGTLWEGVEVEFTCDIFGGNPDYTVVLIYGDGSTWSTATSGTSVSASHTYPLEGDFNATCRVTDSDGDVGEDSELFTVANNPPVTNLYTNISIVDTSTGVEPLSLLFNCTVGDGNDPFDYVIDFGDGSASVPASTASHTYVQDGTYSATCTVTDTDGDSDIDVETVIVYDTEPDANFNYSPSAPVEGDAVSFTDASTAYDGIVAWDWDLGDGNTSTAADPSHIYGLEGSYLVTLCVTDGDGDVTCHSELVDVANNVPVVTVTAVPDTGDEPLDSTITCSATGGNAPLTYLVQYGDGDSTTSTTSSHTYDQDGSYPVVCMVTDDDGDIGTGFATVAVDDTAPSAAFTFLPEEPGAGDTVDFTDTSVPGHDAIVSWAWDFDEDGVTDSTDQDPSWVFATAGVYTVELTVTDSDGSTDTTSRDVIVDVSMPPPTIVPLPSAISVTNESASITWGTTQPADSLVLYGLAPDALSSSAYSGTLEFSHTLPLLGLTEDTTYYYNVTSCNSFARCTTVGPYSFTTLLSASPDVTPPVVVLSSPADGAIDADGNVTVSYTVTDDLAAGLTCDVYSDTSGAWGIDDTQVVGNPGSGSFDYVGLSDGIYTWNVECEDGTNTAFAPADFTFNVILPAATCGDGTLDTGEECDDGNTVSGDSCSALCVIEYCSDSIIQSLVEECDDGNLANGDGCSAVCTLESMPATCGNGAIDPGEECDGFLLGSFECFDLDSFTGGTLSCSPTCTFDTSSCTGTPTGVCGDGVVNPGESCDGADWGPVSGCDYFGYTSGTLSCTGTCSFDTSACTAGPFPIVNSWVYGGFYAANDNADVTETTVTGTTMLNATVQGTPIATITDSTLTYAILTNVTPISNCTVIGTPSEYSTLSDSPCVDAYIDPSTIVNSDTTGSSVRDSTVTDSTATQSGITNSDVANSDFHHCTITDSVVDGLVGSYCTVSGSTVTDSSVENSTITDSTVTDSTVIDSTVTNSTVNNSTLVDMIVTDADISDGIICSGTVSDSVTYDADANGCANLTDVVNYPPTAVISASSTSGTDSLAVDFSGDSSTDPNIPGPLGDSLTYSWDFDASDGITADATGVNVSHTFGVGTHVVTLTVTDSFGGSDTETVTITVTSSGSSGGSSSGGGGGGGGGGGSAGRIYILTVTPDNPTQSFYLRTGDTVKYMSGTDDVSFVFRGILADKVTMGVSSEHTYKEYTLDEDTKYNFNLNDDPANDMAVIPTNLYLGAGNVSFELLNFEERKPILILPPAKPAPRVVEPEPEAEAGEAESQVEPEAEPETVEPETEEAYSEGKLEFIESLSLRKNAPLWAGIGVALLIILAGLGVYFLATRKEED